MTLTEAATAIVIAMIEKGLILPEPDFDETVKKVTEAYHAIYDASHMAKGKGG